MEEQAKMSQQQIDEIIRAQRKKFKAACERDAYLRSIAINQGLI